MLSSSFCISITICGLPGPVLRVFHPSQAHSFESHKRYVPPHPFKVTCKAHSASILRYCAVAALCCSTNPGHSVCSQAGVSESRRSKISSGCSGFSLSREKCQQHVIQSLPMHLYRDLLWKRRRTDGCFLILFLSEVLLVNNTILVWHLEAQRLFFSGQEDSIPEKLSL